MGKMMSNLVLFLTLVFYPAWTQAGEIVFLLGDSTAEYWANKTYLLHDYIVDVNHFIIMLGENDLVIGRSVPEIEEDIQSIVNEASRINPDLSIYVFTVTPRPSAYGSAFEYNRGRLDMALQDKITGANVTDDSSVFFNENGIMLDTFTSDGIHLSIVGYIRIQAFIQDLIPTTGFIVKQPC